MHQLWDIGRVQFILRYFSTWGISSKLVLLSFSWLTPPRVWSNWLSRCEISWNVRHLWIFHCPLPRPRTRPLHQILHLHLPPMRPTIGNGWPPKWSGKWALAMPATATPADTCSGWPPHGCVAPIRSRMSWRPRRAPVCMWRPRPSSTAST